MTIFISLPSESRLETCQKFCELLLWKSVVSKTTHYQHLICLKGPSIQLILTLN